MTAKGQLHLNAFLMSIGHHEASWRLPESDPTANTDVGHYQDLAQTAERGKLDSIFFADRPCCAATSAAGRPARWSRPCCSPPSPRSPSTSGSSPPRRPPTTSRSTWPAGSPRSTTSAAAAPAGTSSPPPAPKRPATSASTTSPPTASATSGPPSSSRWPTSCGTAGTTTPPSPTRRPACGATPRKVRPIDHVGRYFKVRGPLNVPRSPQGYPLLVQAGSSEDGKEFAARYAEAVFTAQQTLADAQAFYADLKRRAAAARPRPRRRQDPARHRAGHRRHRGRGARPGAGARRPDPARVRPGASWPRRCASTPRTWRWTGAARRPARRGRDRGGQEPLHADRQPRPARAADRAPAHRAARRRPRPPHLRRARRSRWPTPSRSGSTAGAADGFNIMPPVLPSGLDAFVDHVVPDAAAARPVPHRVRGHDPARPLRAAPPAGPSAPSARWPSPPPERKEAHP